MSFRSGHKVFVRTLLCAAALVAAMLAPVMAFQFCTMSGRLPTISESMSAADAAVQVRWVSGKKDENDEPGSTRYQITQVVKGPETLKKGATITLDAYRAGKPGDLFLVFGTMDVEIEWGSVLEISETSFKYITEAPSAETATSKRLAYCVEFLESPDPVIANDAFAEFDNAPYEDIVLIVKDLPRQKLRKWIKGNDIPATRLGLYGMLLGLCGDDSDAEILKARIVEKTEDFRLGIDGLMGGYLLLTGDEGLALIDEHKLTDTSVPLSEAFAARQALRFMWSHGEGKISNDRLCQSMRILLDRPELADLVIADLGRWKDWSVQKKVMELYGAEEYDVPSIKRAIVRYMVSSAKDVPEGDGTVEEPQHAIDARKYVAELRQKDPKTVAAAERFFQP